MKQLTGAITIVCSLSIVLRCGGESLGFEERSELVPSSIKQAVRSALFFLEST